MKGEESIVPNSIHTRVQCKFMLRTIKAHTESFIHCVLFCLYQWAHGPCTTPHSIPICRRNCSKKSPAYFMATISTTTLLENWGKRSWIYVRYCKHLFTPFYIYSNYILFLSHIVVSHKVNITCTSTFSLIFVYKINSRRWDTEFNHV